MTLDDVVATFNLPPRSTQAPRRVPKNRIVPRLPRPLGRTFDAGTERLRWVATLKPALVGLAPGELALSSGDPVVVPEVLVFTLEARDDARPDKLAEAVHRAVHMHLLLLTTVDRELQLSLARKRTSLVDEQKVVLVGEPVSGPPIDLDAPSETDRQLLAALALDHRPEADLGALYQRWTAALLAGKVARLSGTFRLLVEPEALGRRTKLMQAHDALQAELATLSRELRSASQIRDRVELSTRLKRGEAQLARLRALL